MRRPKNNRVLNSALRTFRYTVLLAVCCMLSLTLSYHIIQRLVAYDRPTSVPDTGALQTAQSLRGFSNELLRLTSEYLNRVARDFPDSKDSLASWTAHDLGPRLNDLRRRMQGASPAGESHMALLRASDRLAAALAHPEQEQLRRLAAADVLGAAAAAEEHVAQLGMERYLGEPREMPRFGLGPAP